MAALLIKLSLGCIFMGKTEKPSRILAHILLHPGLQLLASPLTAQGWGCNELLHKTGLDLANVQAGRKLWWSLPVVVGQTHKDIGRP